ncbi:DUF4260 domain-containing protein [Herbaspirillum lusitanum]|uniref:DUF4260 domain-containing protein n=1 Tax=Herbaspirillum lusitanum TaxID=213312 RepID=A0ABW9AGW4_9BURK
MAGAAQGGVRQVLRVEGLLVLAGAALFFSTSGFGWGTFFLYLLVPDISLLGYLAGPKIGALSYNLAHSYIGPLACLLSGFWLTLPLLSCAGLIWAAHVGLDRALGYGLKYAQGFHDTHLGKIGRGAKSTSP